METLMTLSSVAFRTATGTALVALAVGGCSNLSNTERGAVIGVGAGGAIGAVVGDAAGSTAKGAIIGAVVGGTAGALIGRRMDEKAETLDEQLEGATVERVGEGILVTFASGILFDFDSSTLRNEARANLEELASALDEEERDYELLVAGHTDSVGTEAYNQSLSERRAAAAASFLVTRGLPSERLRRVGLGESEPVADNDSEIGRQQNRRVEVAIFASEEYREEMTDRYGG
jgi:outer membrane protein OmpA-like peptidoglycan-associated protein